MRTLKAGAGRMIERILPKADAEAGCPPDCTIEWNYNYQRCRRCCDNLACVRYCSPWSYC